jgi:hypothetical protein
VELNKQKIETGIYLINIHSVFIGKIHSFVVLVVC